MTFVNGHHDVTQCRIPYYNPFVMLTTIFLLFFPKNNFNFYINSPIEYVFAVVVFIVDDAARFIYSIANVFFSLDHFFSYHLGLTTYCHRIAQCDSVQLTLAMTSKTHGIYENISLHTFYMLWSCCCCCC